MNQLEDKYYVRFRGRVLGPLTAEKTQELVRRGQITRLHELSPDGLQWKKAEEFTEFYPKKAAIQVQVAAQEVAAASPRRKIEEQEAAPQEVEEKWYVHLDGQNQGPVEESSVRLWATSGRVDRDTLVWKEGMAEWLAAELVRPQWFAGQRASSTASTVAISADTDTHSLAYELSRRTFWIYTTAITLLVFSLIQLISCIFALITRIAAPEASGPVVVAGLLVNLIWLMFSLFAFFCCVQLLRYANFAGILRHAPSASNILIAAERLSSMWLWVGIFVLSALIFITLVFVLVYVGTLRTIFSN